MNSFLSLAFVLLTVISAAFSQTSIRMTVHEESKPCRRMMEQTCLQVQKDGSPEWELFYDNIKGFEFEPGYRYEIVVIRTERPEPVAQDLSKYLYKLDKIISKTAVTTQEIIPSSDAPSDKWKVVSLNGRQLNTEDLYFEFSGNRTNISGKNGCNQFNATVSFNKKNTKVTTSDYVSTMMACWGGDTDLDNQFITAITNKTFKIKMVNNQWIWKRKGKVVLVLERYKEREAVIDPSLEKTAWDYFNGKNLKVIQLDGKSLKNSKAQLQFDVENQRFSGNNGCNQVSGVYITNGNTIHFSKITSTKMACVGEEVQLTESKMQAMLYSEELTVDFAEQVLNIYDTSGKLVAMLAVDDSK